jgi:hypothetical protein
MFLQKVYGTSSNTNVSVEFEILAEDLLMVTVINDTDSAARELNCWRLIEGSQNSLEIEIDADKKIINTITLFIEKGALRPGRIIEGIESKGNIAINTKVFKENEYIDVNGAYAVSVYNKKLTCLFNNCTRVHERFVNGRIEYYMTYSDELCGFSICDLTDDELGKLKVMVNY